MTKSLQAMVTEEARQRIACAPEPTGFEAIARRADGNWGFVFYRVFDAHESLWLYGRLTPKQRRRIIVALCKEMSR